MYNFCGLDIYTLKWTIQIIFCTWFKITHTHKHFLLKHSCIFVSSWCTPLHDVCRKHVWFAHATTHHLQCVLIYVCEYVLCFCLPSTYIPYTCMYGVLVQLISHWHFRCFDVAVVVIVGIQHGAPTHHINITTTAHSLSLSLTIPLCFTLC